MKHFRYIFIVLFLGWLAACTVHEDVEPEKETEEEPSAYFESVTGSRNYPAKELLTKILGNGYGYLELFGLADVKVDAIRYYTKDPEGKRILASGFITCPASASVRGVVLSGHPSIGASREAPSVQMYALESLLAMFGYVVVSPDYIGFGASESLPHPYLHVEATAGASIDMLFAAREYMEAEERPLQNDIYIVGYSQGGAAALAIQKVAEERYAQEIPVNKVIAGGGPYDLVGIFDEVKATSAEPSAYIPMTVIGLDYGDNLGLDYTKVFKEPLLSNYGEWINSKKYSISEINGKMGAGSVEQLLHAGFFDGQGNPEIEELYRSLARNSLIDWKPEAPLVLIHGTKDTTVPFYCSQRAYDSFKSKGCDVKLERVDSDHTGSVASFILKVFTTLNIL